MSGEHMLCNVWTCKLCNARALNHNPVVCRYNASPLGIVTHLNYADTIRKLDACCNICHLPAKYSRLGTCQWRKEN